MSATISAEMVKTLRERTSAGMMDCKKALTEAEGDLDKATELLRKSGAAKASKKADRIAAQGAVVITSDGKQAAMVEVNSETDFVALDPNFTGFADSVVKAVLAEKPADLAALIEKVESQRQALVAKLGENIQLRRFVLTNPAAVTVGTYLHGARIGVLVELDQDNPTLARDIAMHIAASKPLVISPEQVSAELIEQEKTIFMAQAAESGKPKDIIEKMVAGRIKKFVDEVCLLGQPFVKNPEITVGQLLKEHQATVRAFYRFEVGEGIEKVVEDFKEAVMSQVKSST